MKQYTKTFVLKTFYLFLKNTWDYLDPLSNIAAYLFSHKLEPAAEE